MKVKDYSIEDIFEKKLLFLVPFYIFNYGSQKQLEEFENNTEKLASLENEYETIVELLNKLTEQEIISEYYHTVLLEMSRKVVENLAARYENVAEGVKSIMGGTVLNYKAKDIYREGIMEEKKETAITMQEMGMTLDEIACALRVSVARVEEILGLAKV